MDAEEHLEPDHFFDVDNIWLNLPQHPGKAFHLTVDWQLLGEGESGQNRVLCTQQENVHEFLANMTFQELTGKNKIFNTLVCAISAVEKIQHLEFLQPKASCNWQT